MAIRRFARSRGLIAGVVGVFLAGVLFTPAIAHHTVRHNQNQIDNNQQINQQQAQRLTAQRGTIRAVNQSWTHFAQAATDPAPANGVEEGEVRLFANGPLEVFMRCVIDEGGPAGDDRVEIVVTSSEEFFDSDSGGVANAAGDEVVLSSVTVGTGFPQYTEGVPSGSAISELDGTVHSVGIDGDSLGLGLNVFAEECLVNGMGYRESSDS